MTLPRVPDLKLQTVLFLTLSVLLGRSILNALEVFARVRDYSAAGAFSWTSRRTQHRWTQVGLLARFCEALLSGPGYLFINGLQLLVSFDLLYRCTLLNQTPPPPALWFLVAAQALSAIRNSAFGYDGSDRVHLLVLLATTISFKFNDPAARAIGVVFIALQVMLAYFTAGFVKLLAPAWRNGRAMAVVLCSENYGTPQVGKWLLAHRPVSSALGWSVICFELAFPFLVWWGPRATLATLALAFCFHVGVALLMGLNSFVWTFAASYPAVYWLTTRWCSLMAR